MPRGRSGGASPRRARDHAGVIGETIERAEGEGAPAADLAALEAIEARVLWLSTAIVDHANRVRESPSGIKVGGHQASSASVVTLMTALWFAHLRAPETASRSSRTRPPSCTRSTTCSASSTARSSSGCATSVGYRAIRRGPRTPTRSTTHGLGRHRGDPGDLGRPRPPLRRGHFDVPRGGRQIALLGDAELDEAVWEAICDPVVAKLGEVLWIVDLNRQSLDRVVPDMSVGRLLAMFEAAGWQTITVKYGPRLRELFGRDGGGDLRRRIDEMANEEYQRLLRSDAGELRERLPGSGPARRAIARLVSELGDSEVRAAIRDLGGHDLGSVLAGLAECDAVADRPSVLFAYTIKGWRLPIEGHPANHSALLNADQLTALAAEAGRRPGRSVGPLRRRERRGPDVRGGGRTPAPRSDPADRAAAVAGRARSLALRARLHPAGARQAVRRPLPRGAGGRIPSGDREPRRRVVDQPRRLDQPGRVWSLGDRIDWFAHDTDTLVRWRETDHGQHVELGIAEVNLVGLLGELGATWSRDGQPLLPVGTIYDPFLMRCYEPWAFGIYAGGQSILIGTPSG